MMRDCFLSGPGEMGCRVGSPRRRAFTLVELLVVIAIIGVMVGLLLPAVQSAREAARRMSCGNNLKQISLAMLNYESTYKRLPAGGIHMNGYGQSSSSTSWGPSWAVLLLPFIEQGALHDKYNFDLPRARENPTVVGTKVQPYLCPSDEGEINHVNNDVQFARGNYAVNGGSGTAFAGGDYEKKIARGPFSMGGPPSTLASLKDGTSNVLLVSELVIANRASSTRGAWAYPTGVYFSGGSRYGNPPDPQVFLKPNGNALDDANADRPSSCSTHWNTDRQLRCIAANPNDRAFQTARSHHPGGVQAARGDGSVAFISDAVNLATWLRLLSQADGEVLGEY